MIKLSNKTLSALPAKTSRPSYDREALSAGIVHIGVGNFHRAHQAWYLHRLFEQGLDHDWAIVGAGVRAFDETQRQKLAAQDYLTTLIELDPQGRSAEVVGAMIDFVPVEDANWALIDRMAKPDIRIVALTVTEGGYYIDPATKGFDASHPDIVHDAQNPNAPRTAFGAMIAALKKRRQNSERPFTGMSCDNLQGNGNILKQTVVSLARMSDPGLADWIESECSFPNSMVDCIVPATGPNELALVQDFGIADAVPVTHENFRQWVIEDDFCAGRPSWDKAGAIFSEQVHRFEAMKIRVLNGGHQIIANVGEVLSVPTIADCMAHPQIGAFFSKVARDEIAPLVLPAPGMPAQAYVDLVERRFSNPEIIDTTRRVAFDGSSRHPGFIVPSIQSALREGGASMSGLALVEACWARMCEGTREDGSVIEANDPFWDDLRRIAIEAKTRPEAWISQSQYYGDIGSNSEFSERFDHWLRKIWNDGIIAAIDAYLAE
ncbi:mannitol dehydrogenase family protein [Shimia abyssi]|uniref:Mannitol 2-dehydrogenase n=1 Tax=Shimia abyssi TaxID=1662395 RepID=A0A2P8F1X2_9RHOB|nr:mannitol dehydrogenase family protein [Shimia abyssi]PSL15712.1 mannitol 2-dehydrogenase [Shimia abyssi]